MLTESRRALPPDGAPPGTLQFEQKLSTGFCSVRCPRGIRRHMPTAPMGGAAVRAEMRWSNSRADEQQVRAGDPVRARCRQVQPKSSDSCSDADGAGRGGGAPSWCAAFQRSVSSSFQPLGGGHETPQAASWSRFQPPAGVRAASISSGDSSSGIGGERSACSSCPPIAVWKREKPALSPSRTHSSGTGVLALVGASVPTGAKKICPLRSHVVNFSATRSSNTSCRSCRTPSSCSARM